MSWVPPASWPPHAVRNYAKYVTTKDSKSELDVESLTVEAHISEFGLCKTSMTFDLVSAQKQSGWKLNLFIWLPFGATVTGYSVDYQERTKTSEFFMLDACMVDASKVRSPHPQPDEDERPNAASFLPPSPSFPPNIFQVVLDCNHNYGHKNDKRTVKVDFLSQLSLDPTTGAQFYYFPAAMTTPLNFKMDIFAHMSSNSVAPKFQNDQFSETKFESTAQGVYKASFASSDDKKFQFRSETSAVSVKLEPSDRMRTQILVSTPKDSARLGSETYFAIRMPAQRNPLDPKSSKNRLAIFWDASLSCSVGNVAQKQSAALQIARKFAESVQEGKIDLYVFQEKQLRRKKFGASEISALETELKAIVYDGATRLDTLRLSKKASDSTIASVLITDGNTLSYFPSVPSRLLASSAPVHVLTQESERPNRFLLQHIAAASGGLYIDLDQHKTLDLASAILASYSNCPAVSGIDTDEIYSYTVPSGHYMIVGRTSSKTPLDLKIGSDTVRVEAHQDSNDLLPILWALSHLSNLYSDSQQRKSKIISTSQKFSIPTSLTRLLLITETSDFYAVDTPPPPGMVWGLKSYKELMQGRDRPQEDKSEPHWYYWREKVHSSNWEPQTDLYDKWDWTYRAESDLIDRDDLIEETSIRKVSNPKSIASLLDNPLGNPASTSVKATKTVKFNLDGSYFAKDPFQYELCLPSSKSPAPYVAPLRECGKNLVDIQRVYHLHLSSQKGSVAFHFDVAWAALNSDGEERRKFALHVLYNIFELNLKEKTHWRSVAYLLEAHGFAEEALMAYQKAFESQNWIVERRELALALIKFGGPSKYQRALELLELALRNYYGDDHIDYVLRVEHNALLARCKRESIAVKPNPLIADKASKNVEADIRILLSWDSADATVGLFVQEPNGYIVYHKNATSPSGGFLTNTVRDGFGPEQYAIIKAVPGKYRAFARIAERNNTMTREKLLFCRVYFNWARANQTEYCYVFRPEDDKRIIVAEFDIPASGTDDLASAPVTSGGKMPNLPFIFPKWPKDGHFTM